MYSNKENVNILTSLLVAHGVRHAVVCPGSRNAAIVHNLNECADTPSTIRARTCDRAMPSTRSSNEVFKSSDMSNPLYGTSERERLSAVIKGLR